MHTHKHLVLFMDAEQFFNWEYLKYVCLAAFDSKGIINIYVHKGHTRKGFWNDHVAYV